MSDPVNKQAFPKGAMLALVGLVIFSLVAVIVAQRSGFKTGVPDDASPIVDRLDLRFADVGGGTVAVYDAASDTQLLTLEPGTENFIRGVVRSMARERRGLRLGAEIPFRLALHDNGRLTLEDLATGRLIDLQAFGATNAGSFGHLLRMKAAAS